MADTSGQYKDPSWWSSEHESRWGRVKEAFKRDWAQTKHDFGGKTPDLNQDVDNTTRQVVGKEEPPPVPVPNYEERESAYKFGHGARSQYGQTYTSWDDKLESQLRTDWESTGHSGTWDQDRDDIRRGWDYTGDTNP